MREVEFDFDIAGQAKCQTEEIAKQMKTDVLPGCLEALGEIRSCWSTEAGGCFLTAAHREMEKLQYTARLLEYTDTSLGEAILTAKRAEEQAKEIAQLRTY